MKLLMFHAKSFWYKPYNSDSSETEKTIFQNCLVIFIHVEEADKGKSDVVDKAVGNIKWLANKNKTTVVVLHSFAHLSTSKSDPDTANDIIHKMNEKLKINFLILLDNYRSLNTFAKDGPSTRIENS